VCSFGSSQWLSYRRFRRHSIGLRGFGINGLESIEQRGGEAVPPPDARRGIHAQDEKMNLPLEFLFGDMREDRRADIALKDLP